MPHEWADAGFDVSEKDYTLFLGFNYIDSFRAKKR